MDVVPQKHRYLHMVDVVSYKLYSTANAEFVTDFQSFGL